MDFNDNPEEAAFRAEARHWLAANAPRHLETALRALPFATVPNDAALLGESRTWQAKKYDAGWSCLHWPTEYGGRGLPPALRLIWEQEEGIFARLSLIFLTGIGDCGPTLITYAGEADKRRLLPAMARGDEIWCQLFSEPGAGSDLAGVRTRAERSSDGWRVNGQKIWTSVAHLSRWGLLLARTDFSVPKHQGLTCFMVDMQSPGIEIRPIRQASGESGFNEVFLTDVRIPDAQRLGDVGSGWKVALTTLMHERVAGGAAVPSGVDDLFTLARTLTGSKGRRIDEPTVRDRLAEFYVTDMGLKNMGLRQASALSQGRAPGPEGSIHKLVWGTLVQDVSRFALELQGETGIMFDDGNGRGGFQALLMRSLGYRIEAGTDEILRNTIGERILGLPPDIRVDKNVPFNQIPAGSK